MPRGRPTKLTPELIERAKGYVNYRREENKLPTLEGLSVYLNINRDTVYDWRNKHDSFSDIVDNIMAEQGDELITKGIKGEYNASIAKLLLTKHNYTDRQDITSNNKTLPTPILGGTDLRTDNSNNEASSTQ